MSLLSEILESARIAGAALRANKLRSALTTLGVVIGIVTVTLMGTAMNGITQAFRKSISSLGADVLYVARFPWMGFQDWRLFRNRREITLEQAREVERQARTALAVAPQADENGTVVYNRRKANGVWLVGNTEQSLLIRGLTLAEGRWFSAAEVGSGRPVCVVGAYLARGFFPQGGALGQRIRVKDFTYEIIGVIEEMGSFLGGWNQDNQVVVPITRFERDFMVLRDYVIAVKARSPQEVDECVEEVRSIMRRLRRVAPGAPDDFAINQQDAFMQFFLAFGGTVGAVGLFITGLSLFVGGIGIMNIMFVSVAERTREIGIRKALGAKRRAILAQFLIEAAGITLGAGLLGLGIAWPATWAIDRFTSFAAEMSWWIVAVALTVSVFTGVIAGFIPAWRASRLDPVEALRAE
ncbi:MAG: ABC transporter permease [Verrucomicrobiota bacterium]